MKSTLKGKVLDLKGKRKIERASLWEKEKFFKPSSVDGCIKSHQPVPPDSRIPIRSEATNQRRGSDRAPTSESQQGSDNGLTFCLGNRDALGGSSADRPFLSTDKDYPKANKARNGKQRVPVLSQNELSTWTLNSYLLLAVSLTRLHITRRFLSGSARRAA